MAQSGGRATGVHAHAVRRSSDVAVAAALHGGHAEGVCPYAIAEEVSWTEGGWWWPRGAHGRASAWCLRGAWLGSWRLDWAVHMQKHKFGVTCPDRLFMESAPGTPEHEK
jgi:hypothetical protein